MLVLRRIALPFINAFVITACLFGLMYSLIYTPDPQLNLKADVFNFTPVSVPKDSEVKIITARPSEPQKVEPLPPVPKDLVPMDLDPVQTAGWIDQPIDNGIGSLDLPSDAQLTIAMGYQPVYPNSAAMRGVEGFVVVGFSVSAAGDVFDAHILESNPKGTFDKSALKAIKKFKYRARTVDGKPVSTDGQRYMFSYKLET